MILSWKLWRTLHRPPPRYFQRRVSGNNELDLLYARFKAQLTPRRRVLLAAVITLVALWHLGVTNLLLLVLLLPGLLVIALMLLPGVIALFFMAGVLLLGVGYWSARISQGVLREQTRHTYDLLCVGPSGPLGANWSIANSELHQGWLYNTLYIITLIVMLVGGVLLGVMVLIALYVIFSTSSTLEIVAALRTLADLTVLLAVFWAHYQQSVVIGALVGVYAPQQLGTEAPWVAFGLSALLQVGTYGGVLAAVQVLSPYMAHVTALSHSALYIAVPLVIFAALLILREATVMILWRLIAQDLNAPTAELERLIQSLMW